FWRGAYRTTPKRAFSSHTITSAVIVTIVTQERILVISPFARRPIRRRLFTKRMINTSKMGSYALSPLTSPLPSCQSIEEEDRTSDQYQRSQGQEEVGQPAKLVFSHNLAAIADRYEINDHDRREHTREYIGIEAQFDGVNAQQCESQADQHRGGQHDVETLGLPGLLGETGGPAEGVSHRICTTDGHNRDGDQSRTDQSKRSADSGKAEIDLWHK